MMKVNDINDRSFLNVLSKNNLAKIDIDDRLIESFKRVLTKIQAYFNANGYTKNRNYTDFLNEYLLTSSKKLQIKLNNTPSKYGGLGLFQKDPTGRISIHIDEKLLKESDYYLDHTLCHEFIHFLVMSNLTIESSDPNIYKGGFINEALTEMLTEQIYPGVQAYVPQVKMMTFANALTDKVNNYQLFLEGHIDARGGASAWNNFVSLVEKYQIEQEDLGFDFKKALLDKTYVDAQRYIIEANISAHTIKTISEYVDCLKKLNLSPVPDQMWISNFIDKIDDFFIANNKIRDPKIKEILKKYLKEYRRLNDELELYNGTDVVEFKVGDITIAIDANHKIYCPTNYIFQYADKTGECRLTIGQNSYNFNFNDLVFNNRRQDIISKQRIIRNYFNETLANNISAIKTISHNKGLIRLERFKLPFMGNDSEKVGNTYIYIATYKDHIEILNSAIQFAKSTNIQVSKYLGYISGPNGLIYTTPSSKINEGITFANINQSNIERKSISYLVEELSKTIVEDDIKDIIEQYRQSSDYDESDEQDYDTLKQFALRQYAKNQYQALTEKEKQNITSKIVGTLPKYILYEKDNKHNVAVIVNSKNKTAYSGESEVLIDSQISSMWLTLYQELAAYPIYNQDNSTLVINTDFNGHIISSTDNPKTEETLESLSSKQEKIRTEYQQISSEIEKLIKENSLYPVSDYQIKLEELMEKRDYLNDEMQKINTQINSIKWQVSDEIETHHKAVIFRIEKLLGIEITPISHFEYNQEIKIPITILKDTDELEREKSKIQKQLEEEYYNGAIDLRTYSTMKKEIEIEYQNMIVSAPAPLKKPSFSPSTSKPLNTTSTYTNPNILASVLSQDETIEKINTERKELQKREFLALATSLGLDIDKISDIDSLLEQKKFVETMQQPTSSSPKKK